MPSQRAFTPPEQQARHRGGRHARAELEAVRGDPEKRALLGLTADDDFEDALRAADEPATQQTGREGLAGPSEHGVVTTGEFLAVVPLGGGYYFVPPIPDRDVSRIGQPYLE